MAYGNTTVIFVGTAISESSLDTRDLRGANHHFHFSVKEPIRGIQSSDIDVFTGHGGGDCGFGFQIGETYLVYAYEHQGKISTGICTRTRLLSKAAEDMEFFHSISGSAPSASISGTLLKRPLGSTPDSRQKNVPLPDIKVNVVPESGEPVSTKTRTDGSFSVDGLMPGKYRVKPQLPSNLTLTYGGEREVNLVEHSCSVQDFLATTNGRISGKLINADGSPAPNLGIKLDPINNPVSPTNLSYVEAKSNADGTFEFKGLDPGEYLLGITLFNPPRSDSPYPKTFYPGVNTADQATRLRVEAAQEVSGIEFRLPPKLISTSVNIEVTLADGRPFPYAGVSVNDTDFNGPPWTGQADANGRAVADVFAGRTYAVSAVVSTPGQQRPCTGYAKFTAEHDSKVRVVIAQENNCRIQ
jgi:hypothetical protein